MSILKTLGKGQSFLKAGFLGFPKSGKTFTAVQLAIGVRKHFKLTGPIVMYDTENGSEYIERIVEKETGQPLLGIKSRSFQDLMGAAKEAESMGNAIFIADSITHPWRELCDAYMASLNDRLKSQGRKARSRMELADIMAVKNLWQPWSDYYLNSKLHIIICGRAGYDWGHEENEQGKKELVKTGVKMKVESEFGFEPSLLVEMERIQPMEDDKKPMVHRATVLGDRFNVIDAKTCDDPTFEFFKPHISLLRQGEGTHVSVDTSVKTSVETDDAGDTEWARERKTRTILSEEIQGLLVAHHPGQDAESKKTKAELLFKHFNTRSWTAVENMQSDKLREGLTAMKLELEPPPPDTQPDDKALFTDQGNVTKPTNGKLPEVEIGASETKVLTGMIAGAKSKAALKGTDDMAKQYLAEGAITTAQFEELEKQIAAKSEQFSKKREPVAA